MSDSRETSSAKPSDAVQQQFGAVAANYAASALFALGADLGELIRAAAPARQEVALDLGTAAGHTALALAPHVRSVVGVDLVPEMVEQARALASERGIENAQFRQADAEVLPFDDVTFDLVVTRFSVHHWPNPVRAFGEVARVLHPGGRVLAIDTIGPDDPEVERFIIAFEQLRDPSHRRSLTLAEWLTALGEAGLEGEVIKQWDLELDFEDWVTRMRTPPKSVATLRAMIDAAPESARRIYHFAQRDGRSFFTLPCALIRSTRRN